MKILFYNHTEKVSGAEKILLLALKRLNRNEFAPVAVCPKGDLSQQIAELGVQVENVGRLKARFTRRVDLLFKYSASLFRVIKQLRTEIFKTKPDLIHANSIRAGIAATVASVGTGLPVFWHIHDELKPHPLSALIRLFVLVFSRTRLIAVSQATADSFRGWLLRQFKNRVSVSVVHNAIELEKFEFNPTNRRKIREELNLKESEFVFGIVGQITPRKGQLELVRTFAEARKLMPSSTLLIVGEPMFNEDRDYLEKVKQTVFSLGLDERVKFTGLRKDVAAIMQALDVLVINSKSEAMVVVAIEAMACGTPVIATSVGGTKEMIEHQANGWLVPFGDGNRLSEALQTLSRQPEMRAAFAAEGEKFAASQLNAERFINDLENLFERFAPQTETAGELLIAER